MERRLVILSLLLCFWPVWVTAQQNLRDRPEVQVVGQYNLRLVDWLQDPKDQSLASKFRQTAISGSNAEEVGVERANTYIERTTHLLSDSHHITRPLGVTTVDENTAIVTTLEDPYWVSSSGRTYIKTSVPHTYRVERAADGWRVSSDDFNIAEGDDVEWKMTEDKGVKTYSWSVCRVSVLTDHLGLFLSTGGLGEYGGLRQEINIDKPPDRESSLHRRYFEAGKMDEAYPGGQPDLFYYNCRRAAEELPPPVKRLFLGHFGLQ